MYVRLWTGAKFPVKNRDEAVEVIKAKLRDWMNRDDRIAWYNSDEDDALKRKPSIAYVVTHYSERTDAFAQIVYETVASAPQGTKGRRPGAKARLSR